MSEFSRTQQDIDSNERFSTGFISRAGSFATVSNSSSCQIKTLARSKMARVAFFLIGCLLTVTAVLKLWMQMTDPIADTNSSKPIALAFFGNSTGR